MTSLAGPWSRISFPPGSRPSGRADDPRRSAFLDQSVPQGARRFPSRQPALPARLQPKILAAEANGLSPRSRSLLEEMRGEWRDLDARIEALDAELMALARGSAAARRLMGVPGIGPLTATALIAAIGIGQVFTCGRDSPPGWAWCHARPRRAASRSSWHRQARQCLSAAPARVRGSCGAASSGEDGQLARRLAARPARAPAPQCGGHRFGQQASPHRLGRHGARPPLRNRPPRRRLNNGDRERHRAKRFQSCLRAAPRR